MIEVTFKTTEQNGMILYNSVGPNKMGDFVFIALKNGEVVFGYNLGQGFKALESPVFVADDEWHTVKVTRYVVSEVV